MITQEQLLDSMNASIKPAGLSETVWNIAKQRALRVWNVVLQGKSHNTQIIFKHSAELELYFDANGVCAIQNFELVSYQPNQVEYLEELSTCMHEFIQAEAYVDAAIQAHRLWMLNPSDLKLAQEVAELYIKADLLMIGLAFLRMCIKEYPANARFYMLRAQVYLELGWLELSLNDLDTAMRFEPVTAEIHVKKAEVLYSSGALGTAIRCLKNGMQFDEHNSEYLTLLAKWQLEIGSNYEAADNAKKAYALNPSSGVVLYLMALTHQAIQMPQEIVSLYSDLAIASGVESTLFMQSQVHKTAGAKCAA